MTFNTDPSIWRNYPEHFGVYLGGNGGVFAIDDTAWLACFRNNADAVATLTAAGWSEHKLKHGGSWWFRGGPPDGWTVFEKDPARLQPSRAVSRGETTVETYRQVRATEER